MSLKNSRSHFNTVATAIERIAHIFALVGSGILALLMALMLVYGIFHRQELNLAAIGISLALLLLFSGITWLIWNIGKFKIALKIIVVLIAVPVTFLGFLTGTLVGRNEYQDLTLPDICKNFDESKPDWVTWQAHRNDIFGERIAKMYPNPISEDDLKKSLVKQGFRLPDYANSDHLPHMWAYAIINSFPCDQTWTVEWTTQGDGIAHDIDGRYNASCL
jgi:hypothetical protein